ncbi:MAG: TM2 domain-containing protein [Hellea sp.]|nr:TM2 domain-containing protein [Hellea sp.]
MSEVKDTVDPRIKKHQVLQILEGRRKNLLITFFLCLIGGFWGAHRYYLGQKKFAISMAVIWLVLIVLTLISGFPHPGQRGFFYNGLMTADLIRNFVLLLSWGYLDTFAILEEVGVGIGGLQKFGSEMSETIKLYWPTKHIIVDVLRLSFGLFVVVELFRTMTLTDRKNEQIRKEIEIEVG